MCNRSGFTPSHTHIYAGGVNSHARYASTTNAHSTRGDRIWDPTSENLQSMYPTYGLDTSSQSMTMVMWRTTCFSHREGSSPLKWVESLGSTPIM